MYHETTVDSTQPMPRGYGFLPKGIAFKTLHCRKLTHASGEPLYVVVDNKSTLGLRAPKTIIAQVHRKAKDTLATRRAAVQKKDAADTDKAAAELKAQFPKMPTVEIDTILKHGFRKHSGRVGRTGSIPLSKKVTLAVIAHIRHRHTNYDSLLSSGEAREDTRRTIWKQVENTMRKWGCTNDLSWYSDSKKKNRSRKKNKRKQREEEKGNSKILQSDSDDSMDADYV